MKRREEKVQEKLFPTKLETQIIGRQKEEQA